jgi:hypothetical protein
VRRGQPFGLPFEDQLGISDSRLGMGGGTEWKTIEQEETPFF